MIVSAGAAAAAAAARLRALHEEEERLTAYSPDDLVKGWEFKIVRANTAAFRKSEVMQQVCAEEARSGWELVEKFDMPASASNAPQPPATSRPQPASIPTARPMAFHKAS